MRDSSVSFLLWFCFFTAIVQADAGKALAISGAAGAAGREVRAWMRYYMCIDLKSFYASVECVERGLDPLTTKLVVADPERTEKTICLAITPAMKELGIRNRCRVFEIPDSVEYMMAPPRMQLYIDYSAKIYGIYLNYIAKEDIHVYSIDEAFFDVTDYLDMYHMGTKELAKAMMDDIYRQTGITATCGIGTNLYLAKVALDITAKHVEQHISILDEKEYRKQLWRHKPLTDFWRIGNGTVRRLERYGIYTMEDIVNTDEDFLYRLFGVDAELLIDHAWGREPVTMEDIKHYHAKTHGMSSGQVLPRDYGHEEGRLIVKEMMDLLCLDMVEKDTVTDSISLYLGYANRLEVSSAKGTVSVPTPTNSARELLPKVEELYDRIKNPAWDIRRVNLSCNRLVHQEYKQYSLFSDPVEEERERDVQHAVLDIKKKYGKNAVLKGMNLEKSAMTRERNKQIGGHKSGE